MIDSIITLMKPYGFVLSEHDIAEAVEQLWCAVGWVGGYQTKGNHRPTPPCFFLFNTIE
jgi:hypothetical protein